MKKQWEPYYSPLFAQALRDLTDFDAKHPSKSDMLLVRSRREQKGKRREGEEEGGGGRGRGGKREGRERNGEVKVDAQRRGKKEEEGGRIIECSTLGRTPNIHKIESILDW